MTALVSVPTSGHGQGSGAFARFLTALETAGSRITPRGPGEVAAQCPAHDDHTASLSVSRCETGVLVHCHAGCGIDGILAALHLARGDLFDESRARRAGFTVVAEYPYTDEHGAVLFVKERRWPKDFRQYKPGPDGRREYKLGTVRRVLYRMPDVTAAIAAGAPVWLAEGEKDADALAAAGVCATTWPEGAWTPGARPKWRPEYTATLAGAHVVLVADDDEPGRHTAATIARLLTGAAASVRVVLPAAGKDATDHLAAGHALDDFRALPTQPTADRGEVSDWAEGCEAIPAGYVVPAGYEVERSGIWALREGKDGTERLPVASAPVVVVAAYVDPAGDQLVELVWLDGDRWVTRTVPRSVTKSGRKLVTQLGDAGFPATESDARAVERWLARSEQANRARIPRHTLARWLGWQPGGTFVTGQDAPHRVEPVYSEQRPALAAHHPAGTLDAWQVAVAGLDAYPVAVIVLSAAFAAPLLDVLHLDSFTVDVSGRSTRGKTTAARLAMSVWADPGERGDGLFSWRTTLLAAEKRLNLVRGLPVVLDETRVVKTPELVDQVLYQVPKNHGAARSGGYPSLLPWRTIVISTGEQSALSFTSHQGAGARVLTIARPPFPAGDGAGPAAEALTAAISANYGTAGPAFVTRLRAELAAGRTGALRGRHAHLTAVHRGDSDLSGRRAPLLAALRLGAELAWAWDVAPVEPPDPAVWAEVFHAEELTDNRPEMALDVVREYVAGNYAALWRPGVHTTPPVTGWAGRLVSTADGPTVALLPQRLREVLTRAGITLDAVLPGWQETGTLQQSGTGRGRWQPNVRLDHARPRMYVFTPGVIPLTSGDDPDDAEGTAGGQQSPGTDPTSYDAELPL
jgi:hypothetical protein